MLQSQAEEELVIAYLSERDKPRDAVRYGLYPNAKAALAAYTALTARLADPNDLGAMAEYHAIATEDVAPYIAQLIQAATAIVGLVEGIDQAAVSAGRAAPFGTASPLPPEASPFVP